MARCGWRMADGGWLMFDDEKPMANEILTLAF